MINNYKDIKAKLAQVIYYQMYRKNYEILESETQDISIRVNKLNRLALAIANEEIINTRIMQNDCCEVTFEPPVSKFDSQLNVKALQLPD